MSNRYGLSLRVPENEMNWWYLEYFHYQLKDMMLRCHIYILYTFILDGVLPINLWLRNHRILIGLSPIALHSIEALLPIRTVWFVTCSRKEAGTVK